MAIEGALVDATTGKGLYIGADMSVVYTDPTQDMAGWTLVLDIRQTDTSPASLASVSGVVSGTYNADPALNTQIVTFTLGAAALAASIFPGDDWVGRYSIARTNAGFKQPLRFGPVLLTRVTQA